MARRAVIFIRLRERGGPRYRTGNIKGHFRFHMEVPASAIPYLCRSESTASAALRPLAISAVHRGMSRMIAASIDARTDPARALG